MTYVEDHLSQCKKPYVGFKVFPEQIFNHNLRFDDLVRYINAKYVIILWRENTLETIVSKLIAEKTNKWYSTEETNLAEKVSIKPEYVYNYVAHYEKEWQKIGSQWPVDVVPIFVKYEDLVANKLETMEHVLSKMSLESDDYEYIIASKRQNPAPLCDKISNWRELPKNLTTIKILVPDILTEAINSSLMVPKESLHVVPDREPAAPHDGWRFRVSEPFTCDKLKQNVIEALYGNSVSSGGYWPQELSQKLKVIFGAPVAQPCCNGFVAIVLALQASGIGNGDEVIMPSMTMIAVANAVSFLQAVPVFVDNKADNYNPGWEEIQSAITEKTKAIIVTHTYGVPTPDLETIVEKCKERKLILIEDISECVGISVTISNGSQKLLGTFGNFAAASMYANKIIHAGDGGFVLAKDPKLQSYLMSMVNHGFTPSYHFLHFECALNGKINGLGAAMACGCLDKMNEILENRSEIAQFYRMRLENTPLKLTPQCGLLDSPWVFGVECQSKQQRRSLRAFMAKHGIETRDFFFPLHLQPAYSYLKSNKTFSNAERLATCGFYLPTHPNLSTYDLRFICDVIDRFFDPNLTLELKAEKKQSKEIVLVKPGKLRVESVQYNGGDIEHCSDRGTNLLDAVQATFEVDHHLTNERWDDRESLLKCMNDCIKNANKANAALVKEHFDPYITYLESQKNFEQSLTCPWQSVNLNSSIYNAASQIATTTDMETLQMLCWLVKETKSKRILEIGCLFGHATILLAATALQVAEEDLPVIYALDGFKWQNWMRRYTPDINLQKDQSFKAMFDQNVASFKNVVNAVTWEYSSNYLPAELQHEQLDLVFIDFTQEAEELEAVWKLISPTFVSNKTIVVVNGLSWKSIPFFAKFADEMEPVIQPHKTLSKAFLYKSKALPANTLMEIPLPRKLDFQVAPDWSHHHQNAFTAVIDKLKIEMDNSDSSTMFLPSVEEYLCENADFQITKQWIGIIHEIPDNFDQFYVPDLRSLCSTKYIDELKLCKGLFTLTKCQANFLQENWPKEVPLIPIHTLTYPYIPPAVQQESNIVQLWTEHSPVRLVLIGSFARDFNLFFEMKVPKNVQKVLLLGNKESSNAAKKAPDNVILCERMSEEEYEKMLQTSIVFLSLLYDGAANTIVLECIARNVPIVCPSWSSCVEYLGEEYPLFYNPQNKETNFEQLITKENVQNAIEYLKNMDKSKFSVDHFVSTIKSSAVFMHVPPFAEQSWLKKLQNPCSYSKYDVTISICSYKRTHHLSKILHSLWEEQDFHGKFEIIIWNNNDQRRDEVTKICEKYIHRSSSEKCLNLINSTKNYCAQIRLAMPALMQSDCLLVCDDDILPESNFISFFMNSKNQYPNEMLCLRGHKFFPHSLDLANPGEVWNDYHNLKFVNDDAPSQNIHFAHVDACLIPKIVLQECASVEMPDPGFALVDDYWMSFISNHKFGRKIRKLSLANVSQAPLQRADDSDQEGLAMHLRPDVKDARLRLYVYHMTQGWPTWQQKNIVNLHPDKLAAIAENKKQFWNTSYFGINASSSLTDNDIEYLRKLGVKFVRIGAVGIGKPKNYEFSEFLRNPENQLELVAQLFSKLETANIQVIITLDRRVASAAVWKCIAEKCSQIQNVVGYDLINEPFTSDEDGAHLSMLPSLEGTLRGFAFLITTISNKQRFPSCFR